MLFCRICPAILSSRISHSAIWVAMSDQGQLRGYGVNHELRPRPKPGMERHPRDALDRAINRFVDTIGDALFQRSSPIRDTASLSPNCEDQHGDDRGYGMTSEASNRRGRHLHV